MKELKLHVERIVRPVRAFQGRKLQMRRELLAHLQSALEEERAGGADEAAAMERAKNRLGEPSELTAKLRESVPALERVLLSDFPTLCQRRVTRKPLGRWRGGGIDSINRLPLGMGLVIAASAGILPVFACLGAASRAPQNMLISYSWSEGWIRLLPAGVLCSMMLQVWISLAWMASLLRSDKKQGRARMLLLGAMLLLLQLWWLPVSGFHSAVQFAGVVAIAAGQLLALCVIARIVESRLHDIEPWLELDLVD